MLRNQRTTVSSSRGSSVDSDYRCKGSSYTEFHSAHLVYNMRMGVSDTKNPI
jgi:hypothetical protein